MQDSKHLQCTSRVPWICYWGWPESKMFETPWVRHPIKDTCHCIKGKDMFYPITLFIDWCVVVCWCVLGQHEVTLYCSKRHQSSPKPPSFSPFMWLLKSLKKNILHFCEQYSNILIPCWSGGPVWFFKSSRPNLLSNSRSTSYIHANLYYLFSHNVHISWHWHKRGSGG